MKGDRLCIDFKVKDEIQKRMREFELKLALRAYSSFNCRSVLQVKSNGQKNFQRLHGQSLDERSEGPETQTYGSDHEDLPVTDHDHDDDEEPESMDDDDDNDDDDTQEVTEAENDSHDAHATTTEHEMIVSP